MKTKLVEFVNQHPTLVEDLRIASGILANNNREILASALWKYSEELKKYDGVDPASVE